MSETKQAQPLSVVNSIAPIRICDNGGWTDTWFAGHGKIFNMAVSPYVEVQIETYPRADDRDRIIIHAENFGDHYAVEPDADGWSRHPLLEAAIAYMGVPEDLAVQVTIFSKAPAGASTGTSAAVSVALLGALDCLTPGRLTPHEIAHAAHAVETNMLKRQSGIQDQLCAAYGGINYIEMFVYPHASVSQLQLPGDVLWELERRLALIYLGKSHDSSRVHEKVIRELEDVGPKSRRLEALRQTAERSRDALYAGDFQAFGQAMQANTEAQQELNPALVGTDAHQIIEIAQQYGALGWKVNGAGGDGGSVTLLCSALSHEKRAMLRALGEANPMLEHIPVRLSLHGLRVWQQEPCNGC